MRRGYLADTHIVLWWLSDDVALPENAREMLMDSSNMVFASSISIWEIAIKSALGKLEADIDDVCASLEPAGFRTLPFTVQDAALTASLPPIHRDPFDRALIAQARSNGLSVMTADRRLAAYGTDVIEV